MDTGSNIEVENTPGSLIARPGENPLVSSVREAKRQSDGQPGAEAPALATADEVPFDFAVESPEVLPDWVKGPNWAFNYAQEILPRRSKAAEAMVLQDPIVACSYARLILKHRWPEAEPVMRNAPTSWARYCKHFGIIESADDEIPDLDIDPLETGTGWLGRERLAKVRKLLGWKEAADAEEIRLPYAAIGYGSDFYRQANYKYLKDNYDFLDFHGEIAGFNLDYRDEDQQALYYEQLSAVDEGTWDKFEDVVAALRNCDVLDEREVERLREKAENDWVESDGCPDFCKACEDQAWATAYTVWAMKRYFNVKAFWDACRLHDRYPEEQDGDNVWMDVEKLADNFTTFAELTELDNKWLPDRAPAVWKAFKRHVFDQDIRSRLTAELYSLTVGKPELRAKVDAMERDDLFAVVDQQIGEPGYREQGVVHWQYSREGYGDNAKTHWFIGTGTTAGTSTSFFSDRDQSANRAMRQLARELLYASGRGTGASPYRVPAEHPEFKFESEEIPDLDYDALSNPEQPDMERFEEFVEAVDRNSSYSLPYTLNSGYFAPLANYEYFKRTYDFLQADRDGDGLEVEPAKLGRDREQQIAYTLNRLSDDVFEQFVKDVDSVSCGSCLDETREVELRYDAESAWINTSGLKDFIDACERASWSTAYIAWMVNHCVTPSVLSQILVELDRMPREEREDGSLYDDMEWVFDASFSEIMDAWPDAEEDAEGAALLAGAPSRWEALKEQLWETRFEQELLHAMDKLAIANPELQDTVTRYTAHDLHDAFFARVKDESYRQEGQPHLEYADDKADVWFLTDDTTDRSMNTERKVMAGIASAIINDASVLRPKGHPELKLEAQIAEDAQSKRARVLSHELMESEDVPDLDFDISSPPECRTWLDVCQNAGLEKVSDDYCLTAWPNGQARVDVHRVGNSSAVSIEAFNEEGALVYDTLVKSSQLSAVRHGIHLAKSACGLANRSNVAESEEIPDLDADLLSAHTHTRPWEALLRELGFELFMVGEDRTWTKSFGKGNCIAAAEDGSGLRLTLTMIRHGDYVGDKDFDNNHLTGNGWTKQDEAELLTLLMPWFDVLGAVNESEEIPDLDVDATSVPAARDWREVCSDMGMEQVVSSADANEYYRAKRGVFPNVMVMLRSDGKLGVTSFSSIGCVKAEGAVGADNITGLRKLVAKAWQRAKVPVNRPAPVAESEIPDLDMDPLATPSMPDWEAMLERSGWKKLPASEGTHGEGWYTYNEQLDREGYAHLDEQGILEFDAWDAASSDSPIASYNGTALCSDAEQVEVACKSALEFLFSEGDYAEDAVDDLDESEIPDLDADALSCPLEPMERLLTEYGFKCNKTRASDIDIWTKELPGGWVLHAGRTGYSNAIDFIVYNAAGRAYTKTYRQIPLPCNGSTDEEQQRVRHVLDTLIRDHAQLTESEEIPDLDADLTDMPVLTVNDVCLSLGMQCLGHAEDSKLVAYAFKEATNVNGCDVSVWVFDKHPDRDFVVKLWHGERLYYTYANVPEASDLRAYIIRAAKQLKRAYGEELLKPELLGGQVAESEEIPDLEYDAVSVPEAAWVNICLANGLVHERFESGCTDQDEQRTRLVKHLSAGDNRGKRRVVVRDRYRDAGQDDVSPPGVLWVLAFDSESMVYKQKLRDDETALLPEFIQHATEAALRDAPPLSYAPPVTESEIPDLDADPLSVPGKDDDEYFGELLDEHGFEWLEGSAEEQWQEGWFSYNDAADVAAEIQPATNGQIHFMVWQDALDPAHRSRAWFRSVAMSDQTALKQAFSDQHSLVWPDQAAVQESVIQEGYDYATLQIGVPQEFGSLVMDWGRANIPEESLYTDPEEPDDYGRETEPHVTVLYGIKASQVPEAVRELGSQYRPFPITLGCVSLFKNEKYDVVKIDVESVWLRQLNAQVTERTEHKESDYDGYHPHVTLAYVKKGTCDRLEGRNIFDSTDKVPSFVATGMTFKAATPKEAGQQRVIDTVLFSRQPVAEAQPYDSLPFPSEAAETSRFLKKLKQRANVHVL